MGNKLLIIACNSKSVLRRLLVLSFNHYLWWNLELKMGKFEAIVKCRCPHCREGVMFVYHVVAFNKFSKMYDSCNFCKTTFNPEPGFYIGAMYFSYAFNLALIIGISLITQFIFKSPIWQSVTLIAISVIILTPFNFRLSRAMMLHLFGGIKFNPTIWVYLIQLLTNAWWIEHSNEKCHLKILSFPRAL